MTDKEPEMPITETPSADVDENSNAEPDLDVDDVKEDATDQARRTPASVSVRSLLIGVVIVVLALAVGVLAWRYISAEQQLAAQAQQVENFKHAEATALNYAVNAAQMNYQDLGGWKAKLVAGTSPELKDKLSKAADSMEQILVSTLR